MIINHEFNLNDEYYGQTSTGVRKATVTYNGPRYLYVDVELETGEIMACHYKSDTPDMETALSSSMQDDDDPETPPTKCIEVDATLKPLLACVVTGTYSMEQIPDYVEELSNGEQWVEAYPEGSRLEEIFNIAKKIYDFEKGDWAEWIFHESGITQEEFFESIDHEITLQEIAMEENVYTDSQVAKINGYIERLKAHKQKVTDTGIPHYKFEYPAGHDVPL